MYFSYRLSARLRFKAALPSNAAQASSNLGPAVGTSGASGAGRAAVPFQLPADKLVFESLGVTAAVHVVVDQLYVQVMQDPELEPLFAGISIPKQRETLVGARNRCTIDRINSLFLRMFLCM